jgi:hypothetical protein
MIKLKNILAEGFAWERKEGKGLPTMAEVQAEYTSKMAENHQSNFSEYSDDALMDMKVNLSRYQGNEDELEKINSELASRKQTMSNEAVSQEEADKRWNDPIQMGMRNISKPATSNSTKAPSNFYREKLTALKAQRKQIEFDMEQEAEPEGGPIAEYYGEALQSVDDQIDAITQKMNTNESIEEATGEDGRTETISAARAAAEVKQYITGKRRDGMGVYNAIIYGIKGGKKVKITSLEQIANFNEFGLTNKWWDSDGDGKPYEPGDDVKKNVNESFVGRLKKNFIGGSIRK